MELVFPAGPFTVAVTADGRTIFAPRIILSGLPQRRQHVAWVASPQMDTVIRLGAVHNGSVDLPPIDLEKFIVLVTEERSTRVREPTGRVVLRGQAPSTRLFPPDLLEFSIGGVPAAEERQHQDHDLPPMPPGLTMLPAEMALRPDVAPFLPQADSATPVARPREVLKVATGDTVRLNAGLVRRIVNGRTYAMYGYNGQYPGPLIQAERGTEIVVQFTTQLPESSSIHWHGIRLDNAFDGVEAVYREFSYRVRFPDAGIYWYHPHVREDVQQDLGLYGNILVRTEYGPAHREQVLLLDDLLVGDSGARGLLPFGKDSPTHALMGRFGNVFLVNGEPRYQLSVRRGEVVRFYLTNASNTRTLNLSFPGARMKVVAADAGPFEREAWAESVVIAPAERYVVHVRFDRPGEVAFVNRIRALDHLFGRFFSQIDTLGIVTVSRERVLRDVNAAFDALRRLPPPLADLHTHVNRSPDKTLVLTLETRGLPFVTERMMQLDSIYFQPVEWSGTMPMMNWASTGRQVRWVLKDAATGRENMEIDWSVRRGAPFKIRLVNARRSVHGMQHPIHLHGQRFLVLAVNGVPTENLAWKDTVLVPAGSVVDILLDAANPGHWMLHCHIAEHLSAGMMMHFTVN